MPWRLVGVQDQRVEFVVRASRGESVSGLCREYEISRPTGYLWLKRFREQGVAGVEEEVPGMRRRVELRCLDRSTSRASRTGILRGCLCTRDSLAAWSGTARNDRLVERATQVVGVVGADRKTEFLRRMQANIRRHPIDAAIEFIA